MSVIPSQEEWDVMERTAKLLIDAKMLPPHLDTPAKVIGIFITGRELGIGMITSTKQIYPTGDGKTGIQAALMRALCYKNIPGFQLQIEQSTDRLCKGRAKRGNGEWTSFTFSMEDAERAQLTGKRAWKQYPKAQLIARVTSALCNIVGPDAILGCYTPEELSIEAETKVVNPVTVNGTVQEDGTDE